MSENYEVINPEKRAIQSDDDTDYDSPADRARDIMSEKLDRDFGAAGDDHPLVITAGSNESLQAKTPENLQKALSDDLYEDSGVFWREWKQNHVAATIREAKRVVKAEHGEGALYREFEHDHPALDEPRMIQLPKQPKNILPMARDLGYTPTIEFEINHEARSIVCRDNGIGMTTAEAIERWNEPGESSSETDFSSAGRMGVGALTWLAIATTDNDFDAGILVKTRTRRHRTIQSDEPVPEHDRRGYKFFSYLGGMIAVPGQVDESFYGTEFHIPVHDSVRMSDFYGEIKKYMELCPVKVLWTETDSTGTIREEEFEPTTFFDQYEHAERDAPAIAVDRPGEYSLAMDQPDVVPKGYSDTDTWLIDMPIDRNERRNQRLDTLYNDHLHLHNEQAIIVAGPNRGLRESEVEELHDDDVPLPTPTMDRDRLSRDEAHERFFDHLQQVASEREREQISDVVNDFFDCDDIYEAMDHVAENTEDFELALKFLSEHYNGNHKSPKSVLQTLIKDVNFDIDDDEMRYTAVESEGYQPRDYSPSSTSPPNMKHRSHPKWPLVELFCRLQDRASYATKGTINPDKKDNRSTKKMYYLLSDTDRIFVAKQISDDRAKVVWNTYPDAIVVKVSNYGTWMDEPFNATKLKNVPFKRKNDEDDDWDIPDAINERHSYSSVRTTDETLSEQLRIRTNADNTAVDTRWDFDTLTDALDETAFGEPIVSGDEGKLHAHSEARGATDHESGHRYIVVFPSTSTGANISEHYSWQAHAALVRANATQCEQLLDYPQVFKPTDFTSFVGDQTYGVVNPFTDEHEYVTATDLFDAETPTLVFDEYYHTAIDMLYGGWPENAPDTDRPERMRVARRTFWDRMVDKWRGSNSYPEFKNPLRPRYACSGCGDGFDSKQGRSLHQNYCDHVDDGHTEVDGDEWRFITVDSEQAKMLRAHAHLNIGREKLKAHNPVYIGRTGGLLQKILSRAAPLREQDVYIQNEFAQVGRYKDSSSTLEKCLWADVWPLDSDVWSRFSSNYRGLKAPEKAMYRWARQHGINPYDFYDKDNRSADAIEYALDAVCGGDN